MNPSHPRATPLSTSLVSPLPDDKRMSNPQKGERNEVGLTKRGALSPQKDQREGVRRMGEGAGWKIFGLINLMTLTAPRERTRPRAVGAHWETHDLRQTRFLTKLQKNGPSSQKAKISLDTGGKPTSRPQTETTGRPLPTRPCLGVPHAQGQVRWARGAACDGPRPNRPSDSWGGHGKSGGEG